MGEKGSTGVDFSTVRNAFDSSTPFTVRELAEVVGESTKEVQNVLIDLADEGVLETKQTRENKRIWWYLPEQESYTASKKQKMNDLQFEELVDAVVDYAIFVLDAEGYIQTWNQGAKRKKGYRKEEAIGKHFSIFYTESNIAESVPEQNLEKAVANGRMEDEGWRVRKDGSRFWADVVISSVYDSTGDLLGFIKVTRDLTERIQYERRLENQNERLKQQNNRLETFANMLAHELRNPLTIAQVYLQQAATGNQDAVQQVDDALGRIEEMIDVLLVTTRGSDATLDRQTVKIRPIAEQAWKPIKPTESELFIETDRRVNVDPIHLQHILENLFRNAVSHNDGDVAVRVGGLPTGFYVADTGNGIPEEQRTEVFDTGFTTSDTGNGLGLAFVKHLVDIYNWTIEITERASGGARFEITAVNEPGIEGPVRTEE
jgi:PAS domain S-box-containing protein